MTVEPVIVRLRPSRVDGAAFTASAAWAATTALFCLRLPSAARIPTLIASIAVLVAMVVGSILTRRRSKLVFSEDAGLRLSGLVQTRSVLTPGERGRVVRLTLVYRLSGWRAQVQLWLGADGRPRVMLNESAWGERELAQLRHLAGVPIETLDRPVSPAQLRRDHPGSVLWIFAHPLICTWIAIVVACAVVFLFSSSSRAAPVRERVTSQTVTGTPFRSADAAERTDYHDRRRPVAPGWDAAAGPHVGVGHTDGRRAKAAFSEPYDPVAAGLADVS